jgi:hypothetical protein
LQLALNDTVRRRPAERVRAAQQHSALIKKPTPCENKGQLADAVESADYYYYYHRAIESTHHATPRTQRSRDARPVGAPRAARWRVVRPGAEAARRGPHTTAGPRRRGQCNLQPVRSAYQRPASSTFLSEQTSHQQPVSSTLLSEQTSTSHQPPANRTGCWSCPQPRAGAQGPYLI